MKNYINVLVFFALLGASSVCLSAHDEPRKPHAIELWADLSFNEEGKLMSVAYPQKDFMPPELFTKLQTEVSRVAFVADGNRDSVKRLYTSLKVIAEFDPITSDVRFISQEMMPRPYWLRNLSEPKIQVRGHWAGRVLVTCVISRKGFCTKTKSQNTSIEVNKLATDIVQSWRFVPQKLDGKEIESDFSTWLTFEAVDPFTSLPFLVTPTFRRQR